MFRESVEEHESAVFSAILKRGSKKTSFFVFFCDFYKKFIKKNISLIAEELDESG